MPLTYSFMRLTCPSDSKNMRAGFLPPLMQWDKEQCTEIIERYERAQDASDKQFREEWGHEVANQFDDMRVARRDTQHYWALLLQWFQQLNEARERALAQMTLFFDRRRECTVRKLALEALCYTVGLNHWHYTLLEPLLGSREDTVHEDHDPATKAIVPLDELTVYFH